jgi:hypothetical protein
MKVITDALASVQITYGQPFWAEDVFPADGRLADTFGYLPSGDPELLDVERCFTVSYRTGVTALAAKVASADAAGQLLSRIANQIGELGSVSQAPSPETPIVSGTYGDRYAFVFAQDRIVCGALGDAAEQVSGVAAAMLERVRPASGAPGQTAAASRAGRPESPFPRVELAGWRLPDNVRVFDATNLWEKIDGRADLYLAFDVVTLTFGTYRGDDDMSLDVYWYDMTEVDNAFGIYRAEYAGDPEAVRVGREGYRAGSGVFFWKGAHYVRIEAAEVSAALSAAAEAVAASIAAAITDDGRLLWADAVLPQKDRRPGSFEYHATNAFGLDFLPAVFGADYESGSERYALFIHRASDADAAQKILSQYARFFVEYGKVLDRDNAEQADLLIGESGGVIDAVFVSGRYLGGVNGAADAGLARRRAVAFRALLDRNLSAASGGGDS